MKRKKTDGTGKGDSDRVINKIAYDKAHSEIFGNKRRTGFSQWCQHGKQTIKDNLEFENCNICDSSKNRTFFVPDLTPRFNRGLGCVTTGTRDSEKKAKAKGLTPIGDAQLEQVFRPPKNDTREIIIEEYKKLKARAERKK